MTNIIRVGITFPPELLKDLDKIVTDMGYKSRSKAIHDTVRTFVNEQKWLSDVQGNKAGSITMMYHHEMRELESDLTNTQHQFESIICASMHVHISEEKCLETIAVRGRAEEIKQLVDRLKARRGVEEVRLNIFSI
ncbi:MAG: nickel-responsive transcriptional regulator NikR [Candidatus Bathyarchaeota archaeon]